jgi:hypothetical protein
MPGTDATYETWFKIHPGFDGTSYEGILEVPGDWGLWVYNGAMVGGCNEGPWHTGAHVTDGEWHHVAARIIGNVFTLFVDGVKAGEGFCGYTAVHDRILGGWGGGRTFVKPMPRTLDEIAVYEHALSDARIAAHAGARTAADDGPGADRAPVTGGGYTQAVLADQPFSYYRLEDRPWNQDGSPSLHVQDSSGNGRHSVMHLGGMDRAPGPITSETRNVSMRPRGHVFPAAAPSSPDVSVETWVKLVAQDEQASNTWVNGGRFGFGFNGVELVVLPMGQVTLLDNLFSDNAWHHVVVTKDSATGEARIYRDGVLHRVMTDASAAPWFGTGTPPPDMLIGGGGVQAGMCIDEVAIYDKVLSASRVSAHFAAASSDAATGGCGGTADVRAGHRPAAPVNTSPPRVRGEAQAGRMIWCDPGEWSGNATTFRYRWFRDGADLGFTEWAIRLSAQDDGRELTCGVVATGPGGDSAEAASVAVVGSGRPAPPGQPHLVADGSDVRAAFTLEWAPTPADPVPANSYVVQYLRHDGEWVQMATAGEPRLLLQNQPEGRLRYRVLGESGGALSDPSPESDPVVIDRTAPRAARAEVATAPAWTSPGGDAWYRDTATVTWHDEGDPDLPDGTPGTGVDAASLPAPETLSATGVHDLAARLRDVAGNEGLTVRTVRVDATAPALDLTCPSLAHVGVVSHVAVTASDSGAGLEGTVPSVLTIDTATAGTRSMSLTVRDLVGHATTRTCSVPVRHRPPTRPVVTAGANPGRGNLTITWSRHPGAPLPDDYVLEARDANDTGWTEVYRGSSQSRTWSTSSPLGQGTWTFRVRAADPAYDAAWSDVSDPVVSDRTAPSAFSAVTDRAPEYDPSGTMNDQWRDTVTVSFTGGADPALPDGSPGSGVDPASVADQTFTTHGMFFATATPADRAGNAASTLWRMGRVDATAPVVDVDCPSSPVVLDRDEEAEWDASDTGSGLATSAGGDIDLDTATVGSRTVTTPVARDRVGHTATASCDYTVIYDWDGFLDPVYNPSYVNDVDAGDVVPMLFSLDGNHGLGVVVGTPTTAPASCSGTKRDIGWTLPPSYTGLQYISGYNVYLYAFHTQASWDGTCRTLTVTLNDGTTHQATFRFQ